MICDAGHWPLNSDRPVVVATANARCYGATRVRWRIVGLLALFSVLYYVLRVDITIAGEPIMHEFHLSPFQLGWAFSAFSVSYTAFMRPTGAWSDRRNGSWSWFLYNYVQ